MSLEAACTSDVVRNGLDRGEENLWIGTTGETVEYRFTEETKVSGIRLVFDSDLNRDYYNMPCNYPLVQPKFKLPPTLIKSYRIEAENEQGERFELSVPENHQRFVRHTVDWKVKSIRLVPLETHGSQTFRLFDFEVC